MYVDASLVEEAERKLGSPQVVHLEHEIGPAELAFVRATQKHGRAHDITLFIFNGDRLALIRKPMFRRPIFRAPSGGLEPGESFDEGARREALEETGLEIELEEYLLRAHVRFTDGEDYLDWTSHVFKARAVGGELSPLDTSEIAETVYGSLEELQGPIRQALLDSGRGLLAYRVALTDAAVEILRPNAGRNAERRQAVTR
ncbi:MAG TPA: NUDIX hydrolase [Chloroflexi bacterium]|nr:NUDIX hydrolase [Chloroflexota bacterium]